MLILDLSSSQSEDIIREAYEQVYLPAFPIPDEREPVESWLSALDRPGDVYRVIVSVLGRDLHDPAQRRIHGIAVSNLFLESGTALLAYNAIRKSKRGKGLGHTMVRMRIDGLLKLAEQIDTPLNGVFLECNDPARVSGKQDSMSPAQRVRIFKRWGAREIPVSYVQPALGEGQDKCRDLCLLAYPHPVNGLYPDGDAVHGFLYDLYRACNIAVPEDDPDYARMVGELATMKRPVKRRPKKR